MDGTPAPAMLIFALLEILSNGIKLLPEVSWLKQAISCFQANHLKITGNAGLLTILFPSVS